MKELTLSLLAVTLIFLAPDLAKAERFEAIPAAILDTETGLMWLSEPCCIHGSWEESDTFTAGLDYAGYQDWRPPTIEELEALFEAIGNPSDFPTQTNHPLFDDMQRYYWTTTPYMVFDISDSTIFYDDVNRYWIWPVRTAFIPATSEQPIAAGNDSGHGKGEGDSDLPVRSNRSPIGPPVRKPCAGDPDLVAANIRCGKNICGVTGTLPPGCVAKTGQTTSYYPGDDGAYQKGCDPAVRPSGGYNFGNYNRPSVPCSSAGFTDNGNGTVTDNLTGLIWLKNANCHGTKRWHNALTYCNTLASGSCGLTDGSSAGDWRLPNIYELRSLFDPSLSSPYLPAGHPFIGVQSASYWSSSTFGGWTQGAWSAYLTNSYSYVTGKGVPIYVWPVRSGNR